MINKTHAIRTSAMAFKKDPFFNSESDSLLYIEDALIVIEEGKVKHFGPYLEIIKKVAKDIPVKSYKNSLAIPGFIDTHSHYPQTEIIGAFGKQLIDWLNNYTFIAEQKFEDFNYAKSVANIFLDTCLNAGTTTVVSFCTVHENSVEAFFESATEKNMRVIAGKVLMDRNAPLKLLDKNALEGIEATQKLINKWHNFKRNEYAITPRFAPTSSPLQLEYTGELWKKNKGTYLQSHLSENKNEILWVKELFPDCNDYLEVYEKFNLVGEKSIYAHGIHLSESERVRLSKSKTMLSHCPTSNGFLGSGLFDLAKACDNKSPIPIGLATDIGAGTSFSMLKTMNEAYKVAQLQGHSLTAVQAFYLATTGAALSLGLQEKIGNIKEGLEADIVILNLESTPIIKNRMKYAKNIEEVLFIQMIMGDDRAILDVYLAGNKN